MRIPNLPARIVAATLSTLLGSFMLVGCESDFTAPAERVDSTQMVSLGDSYTAGFMGLGLEQRGQAAAFPNLMHQVLLGRGAQSPWIAAPGLGSTSGRTPLFVDPSTFGLTTEALTVGPEVLAINARFPRPYDNLGLPGALTAGIVEGLNSASVGSAPAGFPIGNPFFDLIGRNIPGSPFPVGTVVDQAARLDPDIVTAWSGFNEILGGALSGNPQGAVPSASWIWPSSLFEVHFLALCDAIQAMDPEMVVLATVPNVLATPYMTSRSLGPQPGVRFAMEEDQTGCPSGECVEYMVLTSPISAANATSYVAGACAATPECLVLESNYTLTSSEAQLINATVAAYNQIIQREATARGWALVDAEMEMGALSPAPGPGINRIFPWIQSAPTSPPFQNTGSAFSLDGVHPSEKGHAWLANLFLAALDATYNLDAYSPIDVDGVVNAVGFERLSGDPNLRTDGEIPTFSEAGLRSLEALPEMMRARF